MANKAQYGAAACAMMLFPSMANGQQGSPPNIIYIMADDLGYGDVGCYGQPFIHTPHIDRLAQEGMRFTQAYAGSPVSAPSRASLMTGQHTGHTEVRGNREYWTDAPVVRYGANTDPSRVGQHPYDPAHIILPEIMKDNGYATGLFGKWAGGYEGSASTPDKRGIDEFFGYICQFQAHLYYPNFLNRYSSEQGDTGVVRVVMDENIKYPMWGPGYALRTQYSADLIHRRAMEWISRQKADKPFVAFLTYTIPHAELVQPDDSLLEQYRNKGDFFQDRTWGGDANSRYNATTHVHAQFAAMISRLDAYVGELMQLLREKGMDDNTLVIFTSDNGPHREGGADPDFFGRDVHIRGIKRDCLEGGIRIPFIVWWPGHVAAGSTSDHQLAFYDVMPTFAELIGLRNYEKKYRNRHLRNDYFDGISFLPTLMGDKKSQKEHPFLYWEFAETDQLAVREGDWKMVVRSGVPSLYNLSADIHEDHDLAGEYPDIVRRLIRLILREHTDHSLFPLTLPSAD